MPLVSDLSEARVSTMTHFETGQDIVNAQHLPQRPQSVIDMNQSRTEVDRTRHIGIDFYVRITG